MKNFTQFLLAAGLVTLGSRAASAQVLYDNFETTRLVTYGYVDGALAPAATPTGGTVNTSATCGKYDRSATQYAVVVLDPTNAHMADVSAYSGGTKHLTLKFRSPGPGTAVQLVLQNKAKVAALGYPNGNYGGTFNATSTAATDSWETLTFTYAAGDVSSADASVKATDVDQLVMLVAPGSTTATTYYLDDIMGPELVAGPLVPAAPAAAAILLDNFENTRLVAYPSAQGTVNEAAANPASNAVNSSSTCASFVRDGSQPYATIVIQPKSGTFGDVSGYASGAQQITLKLRSPDAATKVQIVLQNKAKSANGYPNGNYGGTFDAVTSATANEWQTLTFAYTAGAAGSSIDASVLATDVDQIALLIAPNSTVATGMPAKTYYFDDLVGPAFAATATAVRQASTSAAALAPAYPNPAAGRVSLPYSLQKAAVVSLAVYDALGRRAASVFENQARPAGEFSADFSTASLAPGLYICRLVVDGAVLSRQLSVQ
ncbi:T9SS type A sorting domain-containing protein [Hymenobacter psoromatis]|uniref:T9SS type A sorting domain-containing protein n=1 Tax=Hymenobacter psoromatis TaxID=1484116 RepID=UPI001CBAF7C5|nr:T9SS type A sorting domain-containing protein [Hymenobacter psoromatis]